MLDRYAEHGGSFLDTADCYAWWWAQGTDGGQSEDVLGRWMAARGNRDEMFVATKGSGRIDDATQAWPAGAPAADWGYARDHFVGAGATTLRASLDGSLRRLRTDRIDLYYVHVDDRRTPLEETLETLASFVAEGKVRYLGWSNVRTWRLERIRQALNYDAATHFTGTNVCVDGKPWGWRNRGSGDWQTPLWAGSMGLACVLMESRLPAATVDGVRRVVACEADHRAAIPPPSNHVNDTKAEENAWQGNIIALAAAWLSTSQYSPTCFTAHTKRSKSTGFWM